MTCFDYQEDVIRSFHTHQNNIVLKSRQMGLSVITAGYVAWKLCFGRDERILIVANDGNGAVRFLNTVRQFLDALPAFLLPEQRPINNTKQILFSNGCWVKAVASGKNAGRGESLTMLVMDETAFIKDADDIWMAAGLALTATQGKCIMISTPNGTGGIYHETWVGSKKGENNFNRQELHWSIHPILSKDKEKRLDEHGREYVWSPWYQGECERMNWDTVKIAQELDLSFEGSRATAIDSIYIERYERELINEPGPECYYNYLEPLERFIKEKTPFHIFKRPKEGGNYIIGGDVARGDGSDFSTLQIIDADSCEQVAEFQGKLAPDLFAEMVFKVAKDYNDAYVAVECNNQGLVTTLHLKNQLKYPYDKIHHSKSIKKMTNNKFGYAIDENEEIPGFQTTTRTRPLMVNCLVKYLREGIIKLHSTRVLDEFKTFVYINGKPQHAPGYHDDLIFALGIALFMRDTEVEGVFMNKEFFKAMLGGISFNSNNASSKLGIDPQNKAETNKNNPGDDLSWLYAPTSG